MGVFTLQANMARGVLTPLAAARVDTDIYASSIAEGSNVVISRFGGFTRTPGTRYLGELKHQDRRARWVRFEFNRAQVFHLEFGHEYIRFWTPNGRIETSPGVAYEIGAPYDEADLQYIKFRQSADKVYIVCKGYRPMILTRFADANWTLTDYVTKDGPYLPLNSSVTLLTPAERGSAVPIMTTNTTPSGTAGGTPVGANAFKAFNGVSEEVQIGFSGDLSYVFQGSMTKVVDAYWIQAEPSAAQSVRTPTEWEFQGYDGTNWITLDSRHGQTSWTGSEVRFFEFSNSVAYRGYRLLWTSTGDTVTNAGSLGEMGWHEKATTQTPFQLVASNVAGLNGGQGFLPTDELRPVRLMGSDGRWRWAQITNYISSTVVEIQLYGHSLPNTSAISLWQIGEWADASGWPSAIAIYEDRMILSNTPTDPVAVWMSRSAAYDDFSVSSPVVNDDAIKIRATGGNLDEVSHLTETKGALMASTASYIRTISPAQNGASLAPDNVRQQAEVVQPSSFIDPVAIENVFLFIDFYQQRLYETGYSFDADGFIARELSTANEHLFLPGIVRIAYASTPHKVLYCLRMDGKVVAFTYDREQKVAGGTLLDFGGFVEDISSITGTTMTEVWMNVRRTIDGETVRYVERMAEFWREETALDPPIYAACSLVYDNPGVPISTLSGAEALAGETVGVWADGNDVGNAVVDSDGDVALPNGLSADQIVIGKRMPWRVRTLRLAQHGNRDGSGLGRKAKVQSALLDVFETPSGSFRAGSLGQVDTVHVEGAVEYDPDLPVPMLTEMIPMPVDDSWKNNGVFVIEGESMHPASVLAISLSVDGEP